MGENIVIEREYYPFFFKIKGTNIVGKFDPSFFIIGQKLNDLIVPLTDEQQLTVHNMGLNYKYQKTFDEDKESYQYPDSRLILKHTDGSNSWIWMDPGYDDGKFVNKQTGIVCGCSGCAGNHYIYNEDKIGRRTIMSTKNYKNNHCLYCSCENCVCIKRLNNGHFTKYKLLAGDTSVCGKTCPICFQYRI